MSAAANSRPGARVAVATVERLHRLLGGEVQVEGQVLEFIRDRYGARTLLELPPHITREILKRPADFLRAVKEHCEPELRF